MSDLKINIQGRNDNNTITDKDYPKFEESTNRLKPMGGALAAKNIRIVFEPSAVSVLFETIRWGRKYERGDVEQAGILMGNYYRDTSGESEIIWGDVIAVVPADPNLVNATFETIDITVAAWKKMHEDAAVFRADNLQILGWYHTHLDHIKPRFSSVDTQTQRKAFTYEYNFGVVFNPNQKKWSAFYGSDSKECIGEIIFDETLEDKYGQPKIKIMQVSGDSKLKEDGTIVHYNEDGQEIKQYSDVSKKYPASPINENTGFFQRAGRFLDSLFEPRTEKPARQRNNTDIRTSSNIVVSTHFDSDNQADRREDKPKIQIVNVSKTEPTIRYRYFSLSLKDKLIEQSNFGCKIKDADIQLVVQLKQKLIEQTTDNIVLWGTIRGAHSDMELVSITLERSASANAKIIFSKNTSDNNITQLVGMMQQRVNKNSTKYIITINDEQQEIEVLIIHFSRGNII